MRCPFPVSTASLEEHLESVVIVPTSLEKATATSPTTPALIPTHNIEHHPRDERRCQGGADCGAKRRGAGRGDFRLLSVAGSDSFRTARAVSLQNRRGSVADAR